MASGTYCQIVDLISSDNIVGLDKFLSTPEGKDLDISENANVFSYVFIYSSGDILDVVLNHLNIRKCHVQYHFGNKVGAYCAAPDLKRIDGLLKAFIKQASRLMILFLDSWICLFYV